MSIADQPRELEPSSTDIDASVTDNQATTLDEADHSNVSMDDVPAQIQVHLHVTFLETSLLNILLRVRWILIFTLVMKFPLHSNKSWCNWYIQCNNRNITTSNIHYLHPLKMNQMFQVSCFPTWKNVWDHSDIGSDLVKMNLPSYTTHTFSPTLFWTGLDSGSTPTIMSSSVSTVALHGFPGRSKNTWNLMESGWTHFKSLSSP